MNEEAPGTIGLVVTAYMVEGQLSRPLMLSAELWRAVIVSLGLSHT